MRSKPSHLSLIPADSASLPVIRTLLITDFVDSTALVERLGDQRAAQIFERHDAMARDMLEPHRGQEIDKTDGFLFLFHRPVDAVQYALDYHESLREMSADLELDLRARSAIHLGEVVVRENPPEHVSRGAKPVEVEGLAKPMVARLMSAGLGGQVLLTEGAADLARRGLVGDSDSTHLTWCDHGFYQFKGIDEPIRVFEVGHAGHSPLRAPPDSEKAHPCAAPQGEAESTRRTLVLSLAIGTFIMAGIALWYSMSDEELPADTSTQVQVQPRKADTTPTGATPHPAEPPPAPPTPPAEETNPDPSSEDNSTVPEPTPETKPEPPTSPRNSAASRPPRSTPSPPPAPPQPESQPSADEGATDDSESEHQIHMIE